MLPVRLGGGEWTAPVMAEGTRQSGSHTVRGWGALAGAAIRAIRRKPLILGIVWLSQAATGEIVARFRGVCGEQDCKM